MTGVARNREEFIVWVSARRAEHNYVRIRVLPDGSSSVIGSRGSTSRPVDPDETEDFLNAAACAQVLLS